MRNAGLERQSLADTRSVNRQSHQRYVDTFRHGFNIVDHRDYRDPQTYMPPPRTRPEPTLWQAVGPERPPPPQPVPEPPPAIAPLLPTMPTDGPFAESMRSSFGGGFCASFGASSSAGFKAAREAATAASPAPPPPAAAVPAPSRSSSHGGVSLLAEYEQRAAAEHS